MWAPTRNDSEQPDRQEDGNNPSQVAAAAAVAKGQSAKEIESKPRPTRPLSAYNLFFQAERKNMLEELPVRARGKPRHSHGKIGFADLARKIAAKWKALTKEEREPFDEQAAVEKKRYAKEMKVWKKEQEEAKQALRREHEMMVRARTGMGFPGNAGGMSLDAAAAVAGFRDPGTSGVLNLPTTANVTGGMIPVNAFDEFPGTMQHPNQRYDPAMLSSNTTPSFLDTSNPSWGASTQAYQQARQRQLIAQERQRAFQQEQAFARQSMDHNFSNLATNMPSNARDMGLGAYGQDPPGQFNVPRQEIGRADLINQLAGGSYGYQGQATSPYSLYTSQQASNHQANTYPSASFGMRNPYGAAASLGSQERSLMERQYAASRLGGVDPSSRGANWENRFASGSGFASPTAGQQQQQQQHPPNSGGGLPSDEMARYLRDHFGA